MGTRVPCERIEVVEAAHPVSDAAGVQAARSIPERVRGSPKTIWSSACCLGAGRRCWRRRGGRHLRRQAGGEARGLPEVRARRSARSSRVRKHLSSFDQGRTSGSGGRAGQGGDPGHFRRAG
ncbi:DUF4147 domain-containing protein [Caulobacter segnis]